jgi:hypothetical protein
MLDNPTIFTVAPLNWVDDQLDQLDNRVRVRGRWESYEPRRLLALAHASRLTVETEFPLERPEEAGTLRFTHQLLQEYFAAVHLNALGPDHSQVLECLRYDIWDETVVLLAGLTPYPDLLVERLLPLDPFLAARCAGLQPSALSPAVTTSLVETLARLAWDASSPWQEKAIAALGTLPLPSAVPPLLRAMQDQ